MPDLINLIQCYTNIIIRSVIFRKNNKEHGLESFREKSKISIINVTVDEFQNSKIAELDSFRSETKLCFILQ